MSLVRFFTTIFSKIGIARILTAILLFVLLSIRVADPVFVENIRNQSFDLYQRLKPREFTQQPVVIVDIDEASLTAEGRWPWGRDKLARFVELLFDEYEVSIVGFDIVFAEPDESSGLSVLERLAEWLLDLQVSRRRRTVIAIQRLATKVVSASTTSG